MARKRFVVRIERGERWWVADIPEVHTCHTQGRNLAQTRRNIRECLALLLGERVAEAAEFEEHIHYPSGVRPALAKLRRKAERASALQADFEAERRELIHELAKAGFSTQDVGDMVGLSKPRVAQILNEK
ncbi:MAG: type II toxin-antitoxin system HicB family antitoxin [Planctomycetota bacterium]|jgi:predicted RNase H-like HicB family nuclease